MLSRKEFQQLFAAIIPMSQHRINGRNNVDMLHVLNLIAAFCNERVKIDASDSVIRASIGQQQPHEVQNDGTDASTNALESSIERASREFELRCPDFELKQTGGDEYNALRAAYKDLVQWEGK